MGHTWLIFILTFYGQIVAPVLLSAQVSDFDIKVEQKWDILIQNGAVVDGTGGSRFIADVAVLGDQIVAVSSIRLDPGLAREVIDASGKIVSPGFVDIHTHLEPLLNLPGGESHVRQGVTTALGGPDGTAPWPLEQYLDRADEIGVGLNVGFMVGHNTIRREVIGLEARPPTAAEVVQMQDMVDQGMIEGAWGISTGLK